MATELRKTGIKVVGDLPWGAHVCHFYETTQDLLDTLIPYFKAGLENNEFCMWVISEPLTAEEARQALGHAVLELDRYLAERRIEIIPHHEWYLRGEVFDLHTVIAGCEAKLAEALARGYAGLRFTGDASWIQKEDWEDFRAYEKELGGLIARQRMIILCTYSLATSAAADILDVASIHQMAVAMRNGHQEIVETPELKQAKAEIKRLNDELERRVIERTRELAATNEELRREIDERQRAEEALREQKRFLHQIAELTPVVLNVFDLVTERDTYISPDVVNLIGYTPDEIAQMGDPISPFWHPDDIPIAREHLARSKGAADGEVNEFEYRVRRRDGEWRWLASHSMPFARDESGEVRQIITATLDVTERKRAEEELKKQNEVLQTIIDNIPVMIRFLGPDNRVQLVNRAWERTLGWSLEEVQLRNFDLFNELYTDPQERQQALEFVAAATGEWADFRICVRDGRMINGSFANIRLSDGTNISIGQDITERKHAEEALRESEERFRRHFELGLIGMAITSPTKGMIEVNDQFCEILGYESSELLQMIWPEFTHPDDLLADVANFNRVIAGEIDGYSMDKRFIRKDGQIIHATIAVKCLRRADGSVDYFAAMLQDINERKRVEEALRASSEQLRALSTSLNSAREEEGMRIARELHDELGSALTSLKWDLEGIDKMRSEAADPTEARTLREKIEGMMGLIDATLNAVRRISSELRPGILDDLGLVAAIEWQAQQFQVRSGILTQFDSLIENNGFSREYATAIFRIFQEALTNILRHAQATRVNVIIEEEAGEFVLEVRDNGRGISEAEKTTPGALGLIGMRERAHLVGGRIQISGAAGRGTVLTLRVPIPS